MIERIAGAAVIIVVVAGVVLAFLSIGPPAQSRQLSLDRARVTDLSMIRGAIIYYGRSEKKGPPAALRDLTGPLPQGIDMNDPQTGRPYEYRVLSAKRYMLCATFASQQQPENDYSGPSRWFHGAGHTCYTIAFPDGQIVRTWH